MVCLFFFFQAEDGIRDLTVTGVQTCALPISTELLPMWDWVGGRFSVWSAVGFSAMCAIGPDAFRSEERRVGKECRARWTEYDYKKILIDTKLRHQPLLLVVNLYSISLTIR